MTERPPDISIGARARAKRVRFGDKPKTSVRFAGSPQIESASGDSRENLPEEVEPGVEYRDVEITWSAGARIVCDDDDE